MDLLCDDTLGLILRRVVNRSPKDRKSVYLVCKQWLQVETLTRSSIRVFKPDLLLQFLPKFPNLVTFETCSPISNANLVFVAQTCPNLEILTLSINSDEVGEGLCELATRCPKLTKVKFKVKIGKIYIMCEDGVVRREKYILCEDGIVQFLTIAHNLTHLDLGGCTWVTDKSLKAIGSLSCLKELDLSDCCRITDCSLEFLADGSVSKTMKKLNISGCSKITDYGVLLLQKMCVLEELNLAYLAYYKLVTDKSLKAIGSLSCLKELDLSDCCRITDCSLEFLAHGSVSKTMKKLNISDCFRITDYGVSLLQKMCVLEELNLAESMVTDKSLKAIGSLSCLKQLNLSHCYRITDCSLEFLAHGSVSKTMKKLNISRCSKITDYGVLLLQKMCVLEELNFAHCLVTVKSLKAIGSLRCLKELDLSYCWKITDCSLEFLAHGLVSKTIKKLNISGWFKITDYVVMLLQKMCVLEELNLTDCLVNKDVKAVLFSAIPTLKEIVLKSPIDLAKHENI